MAPCGAHAWRWMYPPLQCHAQGWLDVGDGHEIYWESCGNPMGAPALFVHGGPGAGCAADDRRWFDPRHYRVVLFDQRAAGRSRSQGELRANTTAHLVADIERLRDLLHIDRWLLFGGSWGSTLSLAYAQCHPQRVAGLVLRGVFTATPQECRWLYTAQGAALLYRSAWERLISALPAPRGVSVVEAFAASLHCGDPAIEQAAAQAWLQWEQDLMDIELNGQSQVPSGARPQAAVEGPAALAAARIGCHFARNGFFLDPGQLPRQIARLQGIPAIIVQGDRDLVTPPAAAAALHRAWPESRLVRVPEAGHASSHGAMAQQLIAATDVFRHTEASVALATHRRAHGRSLQPWRQAMKDSDTSADAGAAAPQEAAGQPSRRSFLKHAVAGAGTAAAVGATGGAELVAQAAAPSAPAGPAVAKPAAGALIERPGSDFMMDVIRTLDLTYVSTNPGSSFRSLHESLVNYAGNTKPELLTCMHEESAVALAHGYAKGAGKPMGVFVHGTVGLQHASMAIYNAWVDRVPIIMFAGNGIDANKRRPGTEWNHSVQDAAAMVRDFVKWDDAPGSLQHFAESAVRAYKISTTPPMEPVLIMADIDLQEEAVHDSNLKIPKLSRSIPPQGDSAALAEAARLLVEAKAPVIVADRMARDQRGVDLLVKLAERLGAPVVDLGGRLNFPNQHALCHNERRRALMREADVVLLLEVADPWAQFNSMSDPQKIQRYIAKAGVKVINLSMQDVYIRSNYQDFQRYMPADLSINGDAQASLPMLIEQIGKLMTPERDRVAQERAQQLGAQARRSLETLRESAARGWDATPVTTARLAMETYEVIRNEPWALVVSDRIPWARSLWPATKHHQMLGGSGGQGVGYAAPGAVGAALANRDRGLLSVTFQPDGDLMYASGVLWTAAHHKIPLLMVMHNNRGYYQEVMHLQRMAAMHRRRPDQALIGNEIDNPAIDYAKLAQAHGVWAEGPISDPNLLNAALKRALAVVKSGRPALVDVVCQPR
jgi:acetolactate synthase I/II/III large subunit